MKIAIENTENTGDRRGLAISDLAVRALRRGPRLGQPLLVQVSRRREQLDYHRRVVAWWESLSDDHRARVLETYRRYNGGFGNATDTMYWRYSARTGCSTPNAKSNEGRELCATE